MITLSSPHDYVHLFLWAALFGAVGGLAFELLQVRSGDTGSIELPWTRGARYFDLGFLASLIVGAIAAIAVSYFFTPEVLVKETVNNATVVTTKWQIVKVISLSIIVGSAGGAFLDAMRKRVMSQLVGQQLAATQSVAETAIRQFAAAAKTVNTSALGTTGTHVIAAADKAIGAASEAIPEPVANSLRAKVSGTAEEEPVATLLEERSGATPEEQTETVRTEVESTVKQTAENSASALDLQLEAALDSIAQAANYTPQAP